VGAPNRKGESLDDQGREASVHPSLHHARQFSQEIVECAAEGIVVYDLELRYVVLNLFMEQLTGRRAEEVLGK